jgi:hypothetical protein
VRQLLGAALVLVGLTTLTACGSGTGSGAAAPDGAESSETSDPADESTCRADAEPLDEPYSDTFPDSWSFPADTTVYHVEELGATGTVVTAVSSAPFADILDFLNHDAQDAGFTVTDGETEEHDAEANWTSDGFRGRWAIRESSSCPGETVVQVLALQQQ